MTNDILQILHHAWRAMTVTDLAEQIGQERRAVNKEINRMYHHGLIDITGDRPVHADDDSLRDPLWRLTASGKQSAAEARARRRMEEASDDDEA